MKRMILVPLMCLALVLMLTGCASNADTTPSPTMGLTTPDTNGMTMPTATDNTLGGIMDNPLNNGDNILTASDESQKITTSEDALRVSKELRTALEKLTEVNSAVVVAVDNKALVGIEYDTSYQGMLDDRIRGMVLDRAKTISPAIEYVAVSDDQKALTEIESLYQMLENGSPYTTVKANADTLADGMDLYKE